MAQVNHLEVYKGEAVSLDFTMDPVEDISGWTLQFTLKSRAADAVILLSVEGAVVDGESGTFAIPLAHADTIDLDAGVYAYDVQRIDAGSEYPVSVGKFTVKQEVLYP